MHALNDDALLTKRQAADYLTVSVATLDRWRRFNRLPFTKIGKGVRFSLSDLRQVIEAGRTNPKLEV